MNAIASLVFIAMLSSIALGGLAYLIAGRLESLSARGLNPVTLWRMARLAALVPLLVALVSPVLPVPTLALSGDGEPARLAASAPLADRAVFASGPAEAAREAGSATPSATPAASSQADARGYTTLLDEARSRWIEVFAQATSRLCLALYLLGFAAALTGFALNRIAMGRLLARCRPADTRLEGLMAEWAARLGLRADAVRLCLSEATTSPFLTGLRPTIVFPRTLAQNGHGRIGEYALVHELVHIKRGDERDRFLGELLGVFLWFNPAFGRIERRLSLAREMACDAKTLAVLGRRANARAYARALIDVPWVELPSADIISAFGLSVGKVRKMRIKAILEQTGERDGQALFAIAAAAVLSLAVVPVAAAQALVSASLAGQPAAVSVALTGVIETEAATPIRRAIDASPFHALEELERLEALEALEDVDARQVLMNPANWASIVGVATGTSDVISLSLEDANGNPVDIRADANGGGNARIEFTDETGERLVIDVVEENSDGREEVTIGVVDADYPLLHVVSSSGGQTDLRFLDQRRRPVNMAVRERGEAAEIVIEDPRSGERSQFLFVESGPEVFAPASGRVLAAGTDEAGPASVGEYVVIDHATGWSTIYYNLEAVRVSAGDAVAQGDLIAGSRGRGEGMDLGRIGHASALDQTDMTIVRTADLDL